MCLLVLAHHPEAALPLLLVGNRDEQHARQSAPLAWWGDDVIAGGRDLLAGGSWLGATRNGRFAAVTNYPPLIAPPAAPSRGQLVPAFLRDRCSPIDFVQSLADNGHRYAGFSLIVGDLESVAYYNNAHPEPRLLAPGLYGVGNGTLDEDRHRVRDAKAAVGEYLEQGSPSSRSLLDYFTRTDGKPGESPFLAGAVYGTRSTSVLRRDASEMSLEEVVYLADGRVAGTTRLSWSTLR